jgi:alanine-glyoxylate transaminase / serine-glyoxylate transaminase / serine-pyruvate transaminase
MTKKLLMIPGPIEVSPEVTAAFSGPPPGHLAATVIEAHGRAIENMRIVWCADPNSQPFIIPGSGTLGMDSAVANICEAGDKVLLVNSGYFSDRMATMLHRRGAVVTELRAAVGDAPSSVAVANALDKNKYKAVFATHVDTSTGVKIDAEGISKAARMRGVLSVFDGVCATAAERFMMADWGADVYLTASQKAIGLPPGLALLVASERALKRRRELISAPAMVFDWLEWLPIMKAYENRGKSYFSTPATNHIMALDVSLTALVDEGMEAVFQRHQDCAKRFRSLWEKLGLKLVPVSEALTANTLSAVLFPEEKKGPQILADIAKNGVIIAGGLHPEIKTQYFRVGHMGYSSTQDEHIRKALSALEMALIK